MTVVNTRISNQTDLIVAYGALASVARATVTTGPRYFEADARVWRDGDRQEFLVDHLHAVPELPRGSNRAPLTTWAVAVVRNPSCRSLPSLFDAVQPKRSQRVVGLLLNETHLGHIDAAIWDGATIRGLDRLRCIGPGVSSELRSRRSSRQVRAIGGEVFDRLRRMTVTLVGAGRTGCLVAFHLASFPIARLRIIDPQDLSIENLDAMPVMSMADLRKPKAVALAQRLAAFQPELATTALVERAESRVGRRFLAQRAELVITCVDSNVPRLAAGIVCRERLIVHLDIATSVATEPGGQVERSGDVRLIMPGPKSGCVACLGPMPDLDATLYELARPPGALHRGRPQPWDAQRTGSGVRVGSLLTVNSTVVSSAVDVWQQLLAGRIRSSWWLRGRWQQAGWTCDQGPVFAAPDCIFCNDIPRAK
jgi:molybdopterin/thiamine biosynthesis adenylyltransferase